MRWISRSAAWRAVRSTSRSRGRRSGPTDRRRALGEQKPLATFQLSVLFRQNASWQGRLTWLERAEEARFRSVLELVGLLDSALAAWE